MSKRVRLIQKSVPLPELPLEIIGEILGWVKPMKASVLIHFSLISKTITEQTHSILLRKWSERLYQDRSLLLIGESEFSLMIGSKGERYTVSREVMEMLLKIEWPLQSEKDLFLENLFAFQRFALERNWINLKARIERIYIQDNYKSNRLQLVNNIYILPRYQEQ